jgi:hypothetical protein
MQGLPLLCASSIVAASAAIPSSLVARAKVEPAADLAPPVRLDADGKPIDTEEGHAAPFVGDFDGDGIRDLLVGQYGNGALWVFRNTGTNEKPVLAGGVLFKQGTPEGRVPAG